MKDNHIIVRLLAESEKPVVTAVEGYAVGAGAGLAMLGDTVLIVAPLVSPRVGWSQITASCIPCRAERVEQRDSCYYMPRWSKPPMRLLGVGG